MNYTLEEIRKHKNKINELSNKLINIFDVNEEIMINKEIKYETECLLSLLNIKKNEINNINNQNNIGQQQMLAQLQLQQQQMMAQQQEEMMQQMENMLNNLGNNTQLNILINVNFRVSGSASQPISLVNIQSNPEEKVSDIIEKYRNKANDYDDSKKFIFNAKNLNPNLSVAEAGITNNANIFVVRIK